MEKKKADIKRKPKTPSEKHAPKAQTETDSKKHPPKERCPHYRKCGGCQLQNMDYPKQLEWKQGQIEKLLGKICRPETIIGMDNPLHYRNKVSAAFSTDRSGRSISGVYQSSTHRIVPVDACMIEDCKADEIIVTIRSLLKSFRIVPYNEYKGTGILRHVLVKRGFSTGEIMVVLVTATPIFPAKNRFVQVLRERHPEIKTIIHNINPGYTSMVLGEREKPLYGNGYIEDLLCGLRFRISAKSFYQVNPLQTEILYGKAVEFAGLTGRERILDAYCGIGTIGLIASRNANKVISVEQNPDAVADARANARLNQIENVSFYCGDAGDFLIGLAEKKEKLNVIFVDPPRAGCEKGFLTASVELAPEKIVYISCNPETLQRDLLYLTKNGYQTEKIQPVDMFPFTQHIETVVLLSRETS